MIDRRYTWLTGLLVALVAAPLTDAAAQTSDQDLAQELSNPVADLTSVPFQFNYDRGVGANDDGYRLTMNFQPVIPIKLNDDWTLISRTIAPVIQQNNVVPGEGSQFGLGDVVQSAFFVPPPVPLGEDSTLIVGAGPVLLLPTSTDSLLGSEKWGAGPTGVGLVQSGPWTAGGLVNHIWSYAGDDDRADVSATFLQPFVAYTTPDAYTYTLQAEATYNWKSEEWSAPIGAFVGKLTTIGDQPVSFSLGGRYYAASATGGAEGFGARFTMTFLFPSR